MRFADILKCAAFGCALVLIWFWGVTSVRHLAANLLASYLLLWGAGLALSRASRAELRASFFVTTLSLALIVVVLEGLGVAQLVDYRKLLGAQHRFSWLSAGNRYDEELLFLREPGLVLKQVRYRRDMTEKWCLPGEGPPLTIDLTYDDRGFRNAETLSHADVAVIGDSFIEAVQTPSEFTLPRVLAALTGWTVANLGISGYGPQQELVVLERYALPLDPKVIVWAFYEGNDLGGVLRYEELRSRIGSDLPSVPNLVDRSFSKNLLHALYRRFESCRSTERGQLDSGLFHGTDGRAVRLYVTNSSDKLSPEEQISLAYLESVLARAQEKTSARGVRLILVFVPEKLRVYRDYVRFPDDSAALKWGSNDLPERLEEMAAKLTPPAEFLDLTGVFRSAAARGELVYIPDDSHWTPEGHRVAAAALADLLK
jgi:hypothetical protein